MWGFLAQTSSLTTTAEELAPLTAVTLVTAIALLCSKGTHAHAARACLPCRPCAGTLTAGECVPVKPAKTAGQ